MKIQTTSPIRFNHQFLAVYDLYHYYMTMMMMMKATP